MNDLKEKANKIALIVNLILLFVLIYVSIFYKQKIENVCKYENGIVIEKCYNSSGVYFNIMKNYKIINGVYLNVEDFSKYRVGDTIKCK